MKSLKMLWTKIAALALGAILTVGVGATISAVMPAGPVEAATTQTNRRVYAYLEGAWDNNGHMFIHYWGGSAGTNWSSCPEMVNVVSDYWQGLFYYDIPSDVTDFLVKDQSGNVSKNSNQSANVSVASLLDGTNYKAAAVKAWVSDSANRVVGIADTVPGNSGQIAAILNNINSCSTSYAGGYNAWPQLNDLFITPSSLDTSTVVIDNFGPDTTIALKCAYLSARYTADQGSSALNVMPVNDDNVRVTLAVILSILGLSMVSALFFINRRRTVIE